MPFIQGTHPAIILMPSLGPSLHDALHTAGYSQHRGLRWTRENEIMTYRKGFGLGKQNHVQLVAESTGLAVYSHTEPSGYGLTHFLSAIRDEADFNDGARRLKRDLKRVGFLRDE